jgi:translocation and assembly module TamB
MAGTPLNGQTSGTVHAAGNRTDVRIGADLRFANEGQMRLQAMLDRTRAEQFQLVSSLARFDLRSVTDRGPATALTGSLEASGEGYSAETMRATFNAVLSGPTIDSVHVDSIEAHGAVNEGMLSLERAHARLGSGRLEANGTFGLLKGRQGQLDYTLQIDTLAQFARFLPADTASPFMPRPAVRAELLARARADSARMATRTQVERMATGQPAAPALQLDSLRPVPRDSLSGQVSATGQITGGIQAFHLTTDATVAALTARGHSVRSGNVQLKWTDARKPTGAFDLDAALDTVLAGGFALDRVTASLHYQGDFEGGDPGGTAELNVVQDARREYNARADLVLSLDQRSLRFHDLALRFDSTRWTARAPGTIRWGARGIGIDTLELTNASGGRIFANGRLPAEGEGDLQLELRRVQIGDIIALMQSDTMASGLVSAEARLRGTRSSPRIESTFALSEATLRGVAVPDADGRAAYATDRLEADARLTRSGQPLLNAKASLPMRISFGQEGVRTLDSPLSVELHADSLPLDVLPGLTPMVQDVQGRVAGNVTIGGSWKAPDLSGRTVLDLASFRVVPLGVTFQQISGALAFDRTRATIDSVVGYSDGPIRISGAVEFPELNQPRFDLAVNFNRARVLANDNGRVTANARLAVKGPLTRVEVAGDIGIHHGVIYISEMQNKRMMPLDAPVVSNVADTTLADVKQLIQPRNPLLDNMRIDVALTVGRDTWVRNTDMNVEVFTPPDEPPLRVLLDQSNNTMHLTGTLHAERGEYSAFGRSFLLTRGAATFTGESQLNPFIHLIAENEVRLPGREAIDIRIHLGGTMRQPTISLESDAQPPISQTDLLAYLAFGRSSTSLLQQQGSGLAGQGTGSGDLVGGVAALATSQMTSVALSAMLDEFESETARSLKLDVFRITPADLVSEFSFNPDVSTVLLGTEIEVGKYFSRRWFIAGRARARLVQPGARIEYLLPSGFRWVLSWEPRFLPQEPSFEPAATPRTLSVLGTFLRWQFRY